MSRRTETAYKAKSLGKSAQHDEVLWSRGYGKCCGCVAKVHVLIRGGLSRKRPLREAHRMATWGVTGQKSAEVIVGEGIRYRRCNGWKRALTAAPINREVSPHRRAEHEEGVSRHELR